jgi:indole-3-glycerol phosphate synthase
VILDDIALATRKRVEREKEALPLNAIIEAAAALPEKDAGAFENALRSKPVSFICELKKASPSKGVIAREFPYMKIAGEYEAAGAAALSVLTEPDFFLGSLDYLRDITGKISLPALRKDFIIDEYQIYQSRLYGAEAVLLICSLLDAKKIAAFIERAARLGLDALVEAHDADEVKTALDSGARIIGVNNRNLKNFQVDINLSLELRPLVPPDLIFAAESGIQNARDIKALYDANVNAALIGEALMRARDKAAFIRELRSLLP